MVPALLSVPFLTVPNMLFTFLTATEHQAEFFTELPIAITSIYYWSSQRLSFYTRTRIYFSHMHQMTCNFIGFCLPF